MKKTLEQKYTEALEKIIELQDEVQFLQWALDNPEELQELENTEPVAKITSKRNDLN